MQTDTVTKQGGATTEKTAYDYDEDGNVKTKTISGTGVAGAGTNAYTYDFSNELISSTAPGKSITYTYDGAGNRLSAGTTTYTYDVRNNLVADTAGPGKKYTWSSGGWMTKSGSTTITYDGFGRPVSNGSTSYTYDAFDRVAKRNGTAFTYSGRDVEPISDGSFLAAHDPAGNAMTYRDSSGSHLVVADIHSNITMLANTDGTVAASRSYSPFGEVDDASGSNATLGYQSDYTDPSTQQSRMGARGMHRRRGRSRRGTACSASRPILSP